MARVGGLNSGIGGLKAGVEGSMTTDGGLHPRLGYI